MLTVVCRPLTGVMTWNGRHLVRDMTRGRGRRCVLACMVAGLLVAALRRASGALPPRW